jgi:hypothetical protein
MKRHITLTVLSLVSILLFTLHFSDDIVRGLEKGDLSVYPGILLVVAWLYTTLVYPDRRAGLVVMLLFSLGGAAMPLIHMQGAGLVGGRIAGSDAVFFWVWTIVALGVTGLVSAMLAGRALWQGLRAD